MTLKKLHKKTKQTPIKKYCNPLHIQKKSMRKQRNMWFFLFVDKAAINIHYVFVILSNFLFSFH